MTKSRTNESPACERFARIQYGKSLSENIFYVANIRRDMVLLIRKIRIKSELFASDLDLSVH